MNAIAYHPKDGLRDPFDGQKAIANRLIRCVGEPVKRFEEDSLRILRGLRFASVLGFQIEKGSAEAMRQCAERIRKVSLERINVESIEADSGKFCPVRFYRNLGTSSK